jgi:hypothetical protein
VDQARSAYEQAVNGYTKEEREIAAANVKKAIADIAAVQSIIDQMVVYAPVASQAYQRNVEPGEYVSPGVPLVTLIDLNDLWIHFDLSENLVRTLKLGDRFDVTGNTGSFPHTATVSRLAECVAGAGGFELAYGEDDHRMRTAFPIAGIEQFHDAEPCQCALASGASLCGCQTAQGQHRMKARAAVITQRSPTPLTDKSDAEAGVGSQVFWRPAQAQAARGRPSTRPG